MEANKILRIIIMAVAIIVIGFLGYLIFIKQQVGKTPAGFVQPIGELTKEEKLDILKTLSIPSEEELPDKEKKEILNNLAIPPDKDLTMEEKMKILESLMQ